MFSQEASPANHSALQESERERKMTVTSGLKCYELYKRYSPLGSLARTLLASPRWYSPARRLTWDAQMICSRRTTYTVQSRTSHSTQSSAPLKVLDMPSRHFLFRLVPSVRPTAGTGCGLLPTAQTQGLKTNQHGQSNPIPLDLLPTPTVQEYEHPNMEVDSKGRRNPVKGKTDHSIGLGDLASNGLLPTPCAVDETKGAATYNPNSQMGKGLKAMALNGMLPTPIAWDGSGGGKRKTVNGKTTETKHGYSARLKDLAEQTGRISHLSPLFVEEMMGYPLTYLVLPFLSRNGEKKP